MTNKPDMISRADAIALVAENSIVNAIRAIRALPPAQVADPAQIREAALREAADMIGRIAEGYEAGGDGAIACGLYLTEGNVRALIPTPPAVSDDVAALEAEIARLTDLCDCDCDNDDCLRCAHYPTILEQKSADLAKLKGGES